METPKKIIVGCRYPDNEGFEKVIDYEGLDKLRQEFEDLINSKIKELQARYNMLAILIDNNKEDYDLIDVRFHIDLSQFIV